MLMTGVRMIEDLSISVCMGLKTDGMHFPDTKINCNRLTECQRCVETLNNFIKFSFFFSFFLSSIQTVHIDIIKVFIHQLMRK